MQRGITKFSPESLPLSDAMNEFLEPLMAMAIHKEINIDVEIPKTITVFADINMLASTIRNLTSNALKFTPKRGKIKIYAKNKSTDFIEISIQDTGIGMNESLRKKIFEISAHTNRKGTDGEVSTGLGLIICKEFIEKHGGTIWVESKEGVGSTFSFTIPAHS
jgi:signal transduction histidine kinase